MRWVAVLGLCAGCRTAPAIDRADLVLDHAHVFTGDTAQPWSDAVAIRGDRIIAIGADAHRLIAKCRLDLGGKLVIPGINDAHVHAPVVFDAVEVASVGDLAAAVTREPAGTWLHAPLDVDDPTITQDAIDAIAPHHPVWLDNSTGHVALINRAGEAALALTQMPPPAGFIDRPGWYSEYARYAAMRVRARDATDADVAAAIVAFEREAIAFGITTVQTFPLDIDAERLTRILRASPRRLRWHVRRVPIGGVISPPRSPGADPSALVTLAGTKYFLDGTQVERGAALAEPYSDAPAQRGRLDWPDARVRDMVSRARDTGDALHLHAVGDRAIHQLLDALTSVGGDWRRAHIILEHGDALSAADLPRLRALGIVVVQNPYHADPSLPNAARLGTRPWMPLRTLLAADIPLAFGSDGPLDPFAGIALATQHGAESLTREQALIAYTAGGARVENLERVKGRIAPGMLADIAVLSADIFAAGAIGRPHSDLTIVGGTIVHGADCAQARQ